MNAKKMIVRRGQSLVEFALVAPLFFLLIMALLDFGRLFFTQMTLQNALRQAGRFAVTGNHLPDPSNPGQSLSRVDSIKQVAQKGAMGFAVSNIEISSQPVDATGGPSGEVVAGYAGGPGEVVTVLLSYDLKLLTPFVAQLFSNGTYHFEVSATFKNEPFSTDSAN